MTRECLAILVDRVSSQLSHVTRWQDGRESVAGAFGRQALAIVWDYAEANPLGDATGSYDGALTWVAAFIERTNFDGGQVEVADATDHPIPDQAAAVWFTDPPYYDAIPYADLSDYFLVWLKRSLRGDPLLQDRFDVTNALTPKLQECVWNQAHNANGRPKDAAFFEATIAKAFGEGRRVLDPAGIGCVIFAHQSTEGWEALLSP